MCHIKAAKADGPRYDANQTDEERHHFDNLVLLCRNHYVEVDADEGTYTVARLIDMKGKHEGSATSMLDTDAASGATLLFAVAEAGGIVAHSVHVGTINVHSGVAKATDEVRADALRGYFAPELARVVARQVHILSRAVPNFVTTSVGRVAIPTDTWPSLRPS